MMIPGQHDWSHNPDDSHRQLADIYQATQDSAPVSLQNCQHTVTVRLTGRDEGDQCRATDLSDEDITISSYIPQLATLLSQSPLSTLSTICFLRKN